LSPLVHGSEWTDSDISNSNRADPLKVVVVGRNFPMALLDLIFLMVWGAIFQTQRG